MAAGLLLATGAFYWAAIRALQEPLATSILERDLLIALTAVVIAGTSATLMGAWHFTSSAVRPVAEITAQAMRIEAGTLDQRIVAHADTEEYEGLVGVLNRMLERLEQGFTAQRRFTADVSHELRTPLTALRGQIEVALRAPRTQPQYVQVLRSSLEEIDRLAALSTDLLFISRADARLVTPRLVPTDVAALMRERLERLRPQFRERDLSLSCAFPSPAQVLVDPDLVDRILNQLLDNAVRYTPAGGAVTVQLYRLPPEALRLSVENTGPGIDPASLPHLFEAFYRADPARTRSEEGGTGLGLTLVAAIARLHGGEARVSSVPGQTRFEVDVPAPTAS
jgi:two-component system heavy metal sensor histidine kinase CusS